jgi:hypothetical protein
LCRGLVSLIFEFLPGPLPAPPGNQCKQRKYRDDRPYQTPKASDCGWREVTGPAQFCFLSRAVWGLIGLGLLLPRPFADHGLLMPGQAAKLQAGLGRAPVPHHGPGLQPQAEVWQKKLHRDRIRDTDFFSEGDCDPPLPEVQGASSKAVGGAGAYEGDPDRDGQGTTRGAAMRKRPQRRSAGGAQRLPLVLGNEPEPFSLRDAM